MMSSLNQNHTFENRYAIPSYKRPVLKCIMSRTRNEYVFYLHVEKDVYFVPPLGESSVLPSVRVHVYITEKIQ